MSNFICEKCNQTCYDTPRGYVTGCKHHPPDTKAVNHMYKCYLETRNALEELWLLDGFAPDELTEKIEKLLKNKY